MSRPAPLVELLAHLNNIRLALSAIFKWQQQSDRFAADEREAAAAARADTATRLEILAVGLAELAVVGEENYIAGNGFTVQAAESFEALRREVHQVRREQHRRPQVRASMGPRLRALRYAQPRTRRAAPATTAIVLVSRERAA